MVQTPTLDSSRLQLVRRLLAEPEGVISVLMSLTSQPTLVKTILSEILAIDGWTTVTVMSANVAGSENPINSVVLNGHLRGLFLSIVVSADAADLAGAAQPQPARVGSLFIGGDVTEELEILLEKLLEQGFRLKRRVRYKQTWHDKQMGRQPLPEALVRDLPTATRGYLQLLLGQDEERALQVQLAWGDGKSRLFIPSESHKPS